MFTAIGAVETYAARAGGWLPVLFIENVTGITHRRQVPGQEVRLFPDMFTAPDAVGPLTLVASR